MGIILAAGAGTRMQSTLPKVLHEVNGKSMVQSSIDALKKAGAEEIVVVVGYKKEMVMEKLGDQVKYAVQEQQLGTGHAVKAAAEHIKNYDGKVVVVYGDNPLLKVETIQKLVTSVDEEHSCSLLTISLLNPSQAGRIVRDKSGRFLKVIEEQDCSKEQKKISYINCGSYCFKSNLLLTALDQLKSNNSQDEYYLTDVPGYFVESGEKVQLVEATDVFEILGINDKKHLEFAETAQTIEYAEAFYEIIDAASKLKKAE